MARLLPNRRLSLIWSTVIVLFLIFEAFWLLPSYFGIESLSSRLKPESPPESNLAKPQAAPAPAPPPHNKIQPPPKGSQPPPGVKNEYEQEAKAKADAERPDSEEPEKSEEDEKNGEDDEEEEEEEVEDEDSPDGEDTPSKLNKQEKTKPNKVQETPTICPELPGMEDVFIIIKTGATEIERRLPVHFETTLRCVPNFIIYSDYEEKIKGHEVHDILAGYSDEIKQKNDNFEIYRRLQKKGKKALTDEEKKEGTWGTGWNLDKWKFLPIINQALKERPNMKWYILIEADTYIMLSNLVKWLHRLDHKKAIYTGSPTQINDITFAHGGSGIIMSHLAMQKAADRYKTNLAHYNKFTDKEWAGDCVLGKLMDDAGVPLLWSWPLLQGEKPSELDHDSFAWERRLMCHPVVTYHHVDAQEIRYMWEFENKWKRHRNVTLRHQDVFLEHVVPNLSEKPRVGWDNLAPLYGFSKHADKPQMDEEQQKTYDTLNFEECRVNCKKRKNCFQFATAAGQCHVSNLITLGHRNTEFPDGIFSAWHVERINQYVNRIPQCPPRDSNWIVS